MTSFLVKVTGTALNERSNSDETYSFISEPFEVHPSEDYLVREAVREAVQGYERLFDCENIISTKFSTVDDRELSIATFNIRSENYAAVQRSSLLLLSLIEDQIRYKLNI